MIGYMVRVGDTFLTANGVTSDPLLALRFARKEDAEAWANALSIVFDVVPILMSPQWPAELREVRDALIEAEALQEKAMRARLNNWWPRGTHKAANAAMRRAQKLCYEVFKRAMLREPMAPAKVVLPAKAQG